MSEHAFACRVSSSPHSPPLTLLLMKCMGDVPIQLPNDTCKPAKVCVYNCTTRQGCHRRSLKYTGILYLPLSVLVLHLNQFQQALIDGGQEPMSLTGHDAHAPDDCTRSGAKALTHCTRCNTCAMASAVAAPVVLTIELVYRIVATE